MKYLPFKILAVAAIILSGFSAYTSYQAGTLPVSPMQIVGADATQLIGGFPYFLAGSGISSTATTITVTSFTVPQNGYKIQDSDLSSTFYITLEPGNRSKQEFASCTTATQNSNGSATFTGCVRGLSPVPDYTASTTLRFPHSGATTLIFSNPPQIYREALFAGNNSTSTAILMFSSTTPPRYDSTAAQHLGTYISTSSELASVDYVNQTVLSGGANSTEAIKGLVELATGLEQASSTALGGTGAGLVTQAKYATDTPQTGCSVGYTSVAGAGCSVIAQLTGKIRQTFLNLAELWTFTAGLTSTATTTVAGSSVTSNAFVINGLPYQFPSTQMASGTLWVNNGVGRFFALKQSVYILAANSQLNSATSNTSTTSLATILIPANTFSANSTITVLANWENSGGDNCGIQTDLGTGSATTSQFQYKDNGGYAINSFKTQMMATSTSAVFSTTLAQRSAGLGTFVAPTGAQNSTSNVPTNAISYISLGARSIGGGNSCILDGYSVKVEQLP